MKVGAAIVIAIIVLGGGYYVYTNTETQESTQSLPKAGDSMEKDGDAMMEKDGDAMEKDGDAMMGKGTFDYSGILEDVSGGNATGDAKAGFSDGTYNLVATFEGLPVPQGTDFYEGWVVRRGENMSVVSTGKVTEEEVGYVNHFTSNTDLTDHDFYVLTIEPDDGDPAPAGHILEGVLTRN